MRGIAIAAAFMKFPTLILAILFEHPDKAGLPENDDTDFMRAPRFLYYREKI